MNNIKLATFRLGKTSVSDIQYLNNLPAGVQKDAYSFSVTCTQIPEELTTDTIVFIWLGSDNSKGIPTEWKQGFKCVGIVTNINKGEKHNDDSQTTIQLKYIFAESVNRLDFLRDNPSAYYYCSDLPIIGIDDHSNQTARMLVEENDRSRIGAFLCALNSVNTTFRDEIKNVIPELDTLFWNDAPAPKELSVIIKDSDNLSLEELASELKMMNNDSDTGASSYRILAFKYPKSLKNAGMTQVLRTAGLPEKYLTEFTKGRQLHELIAQGKWGMSFASQIVSSPHLSIKESYQLITYGAPGTGKSHKINKMAEAFDENHKDRVTFYPTYTYQQFIGAYKPVMEDKQNTQKPVIEDKQDMQKPVMEDNQDTQKSSHEIAYAYVPGPFLRMLIKALLEPEQPFLIIIEEINRANAAAVFGDFFQLLDRDKNGLSEYPITINEDMKSRLIKEDKDDKIKNATFGYTKLSLPSNFFIWATMNSADQGVFPIDTAFKRRWNFEYLGINTNEEEIQDYYFPFKDGYYYWNTIRKTINDKLLAAKINEDKLLGPFFIKLETVQDTTNTPFLEAFKSKVLMYLFEDAVRHNPAALFNGEDGKFSYSIICRQLDEGGLKAVFKFDIEQAKDIDTEIDNNEQPNT